MLTIGEIYWVAGVLEGEGCFTLRDGRPYIYCGMTDRDVVEKLKDTLGLGRVSGPFIRTIIQHKPISVWTLSKQKEAAGLMMTLYPLMGKRRQQKIREILQAWKGNGISKTHCKYGHELTKENVYVNGNTGAKRCRICLSEYAKKIRKQQASYGVRP